MSSERMTDARETLWRIRPLAWECEFTTYQVARTIIGNLVVRQHSRNENEFIASCESGRVCMQFEQRDLATLESAKAAAEKWYFDRLTQALEPVTRGE